MVAARGARVGARAVKWWFAKRFLHPDVVAGYEYVFLWDEDVEADAFDPVRYLDVVRREGLEVSQPALDRRSEIHHGITGRAANGGDVHRRFYKPASVLGGGGCDDGSTGPPCAGWLEVMVPVFSRAAWRCSWGGAERPRPRLGPRLEAQGWRRRQRVRPSTPQGSPLPRRHQGQGRRFAGGGEEEIGR